MLWIWYSTKKTGKIKVNNMEKLEMEKVIGGYTASQLEMLSHQEIPWLNARRGISPDIASSNLIKDIDIYIFFNQQVV